MPAYSCDVRCRASRVARTPQVTTGRRGSCSTSSRSAASHRRRLAKLLMSTMIAALVPLAYTKPYVLHASAEATALRRLAGPTNKIIHGSSEGIRLHARNRSMPSTPSIRQEILRRPDQRERRAGGDRHRARDYKQAARRRRRGADRRAVRHRRPSVAVLGESKTSTAATAQRADQYAARRTNPRHTHTAQTLNVYMHTAYRR